MKVQNSAWSLPVALVITSALSLINVSASAGENSGLLETASKAIADQVDAGELSAAIDNYDASNKASVIDLVDVVAPEESIYINDAPDVDINDAWIAGGFDDETSVGLKLSGAGSADIVDGVAVSGDPDMGIESVSRATPNGAQVVAVIDNQKTAQELAFDLDVPDAATLTQLPDGSITISAPVEIEVSLPGEDARIEAQAEQIIGANVTLDDLDSLTDEQWNALADIPDAETKTVTSIQEIAVIEEPWAIDANGKALETEYVLNGTALIQKIATTEDTAYPVIADPSWTWWVKKGAACASGVLAMATFGYARVSVSIAKLVVQMKKASSASKLGRAYSAWKKLGSTDSKRFAEFGKQIKSLASLVVKHGNRALGRHRSVAGAKGRAAVTFLQEGAKAVGTAFGVYQCWEMVDAL
ncbi:hypothetical protein [Jonesia quinghaiensis]|uniref:hypothetical protein n=1 Tax=Jonesia quinghaiensis TaxID=262806 RepID=UPI0003FA885E|nr:hypothetical protein [Jonesia quinghaiensis]